MSRVLFSWLAGTLLGGALLCAGCQRAEQGMEGRYEADAAASASAVLVLRSDGGGTLNVGAEEAPFRWGLRGRDEVLLHTRQGGAILAKRTPEGLAVDMPGAGWLVFRKEQK